MSVLGEKPFKCDTCNKQFAHHSDLIRHHTVHSGEAQPSIAVILLSFSRLVSTLVSDFCDLFFLLTLLAWSELVISTNHLPPIFHFHPPLLSQSLQAIFVSQGSLRLIMSVPAVFYPWHIFQKFLFYRQPMKSGVWSVSGHVIFWVI